MNLEKEPKKYIKHSELVLFMDSVRKEIEKFSIESLTKNLNAIRFYFSGKYKGKLNIEQIEYYKALEKYLKELLEQKQKKEKTIKVSKELPF